MSETSNVNEFEFLLNMFGYAFDAAIALLFGSAIWGIVLLFSIYIIGTTFEKLIGLFRTEKLEETKKQETIRSKASRLSRKSDFLGGLAIAAPVWMPVAYLILKSAGEKTRDGQYGATAGALLGIATSLFFFIYFIQKDKRNNS